MKSAQTLDRQLKLAMVRLAKERDKLRNIASEADTMAEDCDEAIDDLTRAADAISKYV